MSKVKPVSGWAAVIKRSGWIVRSSVRCTKSAVMEVYPPDYGYDYICVDIVPVRCKRKAK